MQQKEKVILCDCGCDNGFVFKYDGDIVYIDAIRGAFYSEQFSIIGTIKGKARLLRGENPWILGACVKRKQVEEIIGFLKECKCADEPVDNDGYLSLEDAINTPFDLPENEMYDLLLNSKQSRKEILKNREYRACEILLNEEEKEKLINYFEGILQIHDEKAKQWKEEQENMSEKERQTAEKEYWKSIGEKNKREEKKRKFGMGIAVITCISSAFAIRKLKNHQKRSR